MCLLYIKVYCRLRCSHVELDHLFVFSLYFASNCVFDSRAILASREFRTSLSHVRYFEASLNAVQKSTGDFADFYVADPV